MPTAPTNAEVTTIPSLQENDLKGSCWRLNYVLDLIWSHSGGGKGTPGPAGPAGAAGAQGATGPAGGTGNYVVVTPDGSHNATIDLGSNNTTFEITLSVATTHIVNPINSATNMEFLLILRQDNTGGRTITWGNNFKGVSSQIWIDNTPNVYWAAKFVVRPDGKIMLTSVPYAGEVY